MRGFKLPFRKKKIDKQALEAQVLEAIRSVYDPEIPVNIYDLGLIYAIEVADNGDVNVKMTLTTPNCPEAQSLPAQVQTKVKGVAGVNSANVEIVWDPPWTQDRMSEVAKLELGFL